MRGMSVRRLSVLLAAVLLLPLSGCVVIKGEGQPPKWLRGLLPSTSAEATVTRTGTSDKNASGTTVYLTRKGRLVATTRETQGETTLDGALELLLAGPSAEEAKTGIGSAIPAGTSVIAVSRDYGNHAIVDLSREFANGEADRGLRVAQVVYTLTEIPGVDSVIVYIGGKRVERFGPMKDLLRPQVRADYRDFAP